MNNCKCDIFLLLAMLLCFTSFGHSFSIWPFKQQKHLSPVIFVPGDGGSQMNAKLNKTTSPLVICAKTSDWYNMWLNLELIVVPIVYCLVDNMRLHYDPITRTTHNTQGVDIQIPGWGNPEVVEWVDPTHQKSSAYFTFIANKLIDMGYERLVNLHGAPYDFRKAPNEHQQYFIDLKKLVEDTYERNKQTPVTFITHSMGSPLTLVFLQEQTAEWKAKYVQRQISLAGAWAGSMKAVKVFAMGDDLDSFFLDGKVLKDQQVSCPSTSWLLPSPLFWGPQEVLVETASRKYTMSQLEQYFNDLDYRNGWEMRKDTLRYTLNFNPPDVELHCLYGDGLPTVEKLQYKKSQIIGETPKLIMGVGDGTVNQRSLRACHHWQGYQSQNITNLSLWNVDHMGILQHKDVLSYIESVLRI